METLNNQTLYKCDYCGKRFITKQGAERHERNYCYLSPIKKAERLNVINSCEHDFMTVYRTIPGEDWAQEPDYESCVKCGVTEMELDALSALEES